MGYAVPLNSNQSSNLIASQVNPPVWPGWSGSASATTSPHRTASGPASTGRPDPGLEPDPGSSPWSKPSEGSRRCPEISGKASGASCELWGENSLKGYYSNCVRAGPSYSQFIRKRTLLIICRKKKAEKQMLKESEVFPCAQKSQMILRPWKPES